MPKCTSCCSVNSEAQAPTHPLRRFTKNISTDRRIGNSITQGQACRRFCTYKRPCNCLEYGVAAAQWRDSQAQRDFHPPRAQRPRHPHPPADHQSSQSGGPHAGDAVVIRTPNAVDQLQWRRVQLVNFGASLVTRGLSAPFGATVHQLSTFCRRRSTAKGWRAQCLSLAAGRRKSACRCLTQTSYVRCAATSIWSKTNWRRPEHPRARLRNQRSLRFDYQPAEPSTLLRMAVAVTLLRARSRTLC